MEDSDYVEEPRELTQAEIERKIRHENLIKNSIMTDEEVDEWYRNLDEYHLRQKIKLKDITINTYAELKKYATSRKKIEAIVDLMDDRDYSYIYQWYLYYFQR